MAFIFYYPDTNICSKIFIFAIKTRCNNLYDAIH